MRKIAGLILVAILVMGSAVAPAQSTLTAMQDVPRCVGSVHTAEISGNGRSNGSVLTIDTSGCSWPVASTNGVSVHVAHEGSLLPDLLSARSGAKYTGAAGLLNDQTSSESFSEVPEPSTLLLLGTGLLGLARFGWIRRR